MLQFKNKNDKRDVCMCGMLFWRDFRERKYYTISSLTRIDSFYFHLFYYSFGSSQFYPFYLPFVLSIYNISIVLNYVFFFLFQSHCRPGHFSTYMFLPSSHTNTLTDETPEGRAKPQKISYPLSLVSALTCSVFNLQ